MRTVPCVGCQALVPDEDGPTHPYIGASPGCWRLHGELALWAYEHPAPALVQLTVDAYAVQHPGRPERRAIQSVALHLMSLCVQLERGARPSEAVELLRRSAHREYAWLDPPAHRGDLTIVNVLDAPAEKRPQVLEAWPRAAWTAWSSHHAAIRRWLEVLPDARPARDRAG